MHTYSQGYSYPEQSIATAAQHLISYQNMANSNPTEAQKHYRVYNQIRLDLHHSGVPDIDYNINKYVNTYSSQTPYPNAGVVPQGGSGYGFPDPSRVQQNGGMPITTYDPNGEDATTAF